MVHNYKVLDSLCKIKEIMGKNFVNPLDWHRSLDFYLNSQERKKVLQFPWDLSILTDPCPFTPNKKICETHLLFWGFPFSMKKLLQILDFTVVDEKSCFAEILSPRWHLMPLAGQAFVNDKAISFTEHCQMIPKEYCLSLVVEELAKQFFFSLRYHRQLGEYLRFKTEVKEFMFNKKYLQNRSLPKFVKKSQNLYLPKHMYLRCADKYSVDNSLAITMSSQYFIGRVLPFPYQPSEIFPVALSLTRDYPR